MKKKRKFNLIHLTDVHGYMEAHQEVFWEDGGKTFRLAGGYARISQYLRELRNQHQDNVLVLDGGDTFHGTYPVVETKGEILLPILNKLGIDGMTAHWDFGYGPDHFKKLEASLDYPVLAINCYHEKDGSLVFKPWKIKELGGVRVGVIGLASNIVDSVMPDHFSQGIYFTDGREELAGHITHLRDQQQVEVIVLLSHLGFPQNQQLLKEVQGVDICLSGHTHYRTQNKLKVGNTTLVESGCHGSVLGHLEVSLENQAVEVDFELVEVAQDLPQDPEMQEMVAQAMAPYRQYLDQEVGQLSSGTLGRFNILESSMDNLMLRAIAQATSTDLAFSNGWRYGAPIVPGPITNNDLHNIIPVNPIIETVTITGKELGQMLEDNLENTFSSDAFGQKGGYVKRCLGLKAYIKIEAGPGSRIQHLFVGGKPVDPDKQYKASFVTTQGIPPKYGTIRTSTGIRAIDALRDFLKQGPIQEEVYQTFEAV